MYHASAKSPHRQPRYWASANSLEGHRTPQEGNGQTRRQLHWPPQLFILDTEQQHDRLAGPHGNDRLPNDEITRCAPLDGITCYRHPSHARSPVFKGHWRAQTPWPRLPPKRRSPSVILVGRQGQTSANTAKQSPRPGTICNYRLIFSAQPTGIQEPASPSGHAESTVHLAGARESPCELRVLYPMEGKRGTSKANDQQDVGIHQPSFASAWA